MSLQATVTDPVLLAPPLSRFLERRLPGGQFGWPRSSSEQTDTIGGESLTYNRQRAHEGVDLEADIGDPVFAVTDATVAVSGNDPSDGRGPAWIILDHHPSGLGHISVYYHLSVGIAAGSSVSEGQLIGFVGKHSSGSHLHFELRHVTDATGSLSSDRRSVPLNPGPSLEGYSFNDDSATETAASQIDELRVLQHADLEVPYMRIRLQHSRDNFFLPLEHPSVDQLQVAAVLRDAFQSGHDVRLRWVTSTWHARRRIIRGVRMLP